VDPNHLILSGTFGLAVTEDGGQTWTYTCEAAFSDPDTILDPLIGFASNGTLYTGTALELRRSDRDTCEFDIVLGQPGELVPDYTFDVDGQSLLGVVSTVVDGKDQATLQTSSDGTSWEPLGSPIEERSVLTLDVAPSDEQRLYISALAPELDGNGAQVGRGVLLVSRDRGESWEELDIPDTSFDAQPFIARVHPTDPDVIYVRLSGQTLDEFDLPVADDALLVSYDAGESWEELIRQPSKLLAFELSPDAETVLVGFGLPDDAAVAADRRQQGLYRITREAAPDGGADTVRVERFLDQISAHCVTWTPDGLYVCLRQFSAGFEVGFTSNHEFTELGEVTPLLKLNDLRNLTACPSGSEAGVCAGRWETDCQRLLSCSTGAGGGDAAQGGTGGSPTAGTPGVGGTPPSTSGGTPPGEAKPPKSCACRLPGASRWFGADGRAALACLVRGGASLQRRRRRKPGTYPG
jgi:photosystem II stability/assembly factor-like uncharacterized protein